MPFVLRSNNAIAPWHTLAGFLVSVLAGARRFAHTGLLRADRALHAMMGIERFPSDDTIRNFFKRFGIKQVQELFEPLWKWMINRLPKPEGGYSLDLDSTVFERYGKQQGARRGYNPKKRGRPRFSHTAVWTGSEMIIWGGRHFSALDTGSLYCASAEGR